MLAENFSRSASKLYYPLVYSYLVIEGIYGNTSMELKLRSTLVQLSKLGSCHKRQKPQAPIRNCQTRKVANAKGFNHNTNLT